MQALGSRGNWVDLDIDSLGAANSVGVPFSYSKFLNAVSGGGLGPGACVGRTYHCERIELRFLMVMFDITLLAANARVIQAGGTPMLIPLGSWAGGNGPAAPIAFTSATATLPAKLYWSGLRPFRLLVIFDANPKKTGASLSLDRVMDLSHDIGTDSAAMQPFLLQAADQYMIVLDEMVNPKDSTGEMFVERIIDLNAFWRGRGLARPPASVLNTTGSTSATALTSGGYWLMFLGAGQQTFDYYPAVYRGSSRVIYLDDS